MKVSDIKDRLSMKAVTDIVREDFDGVYCGDFLSRAMSRVEEGNLWITIMNNINVIAVASLTDCSAVILCEDVHLMPDALEAAKEKEVTILETSLTAYEACCRINELIK